jgi:hypothetical protein
LYLRNLILELNYRMGSIITYSLAVLTLFIYSVYISTTKGIVGLLLSLAIFLISCSFMDDMGDITAVVVLLGLTYVSISNYMKPKEGFNDANTGMAITERVHTMEKQYGKGKVVGLLSVGSEGFADLNVPKKKSKKEKGQSPNSELTIDPQADADADANADAADGSDATAQAEDGDTPTLTEQEGQKVIAATGGDGKVGDDKLPAKLTGSDAANAVGVSAPSAASTAGSADGFEGAKGLFKLGQMPSDTKSGPFVDVAATMGSAISSLQPEQMAAMTQESQKLMETQKSLMGMLQSMRPVLQDGRQLLDTFSGIFGGMGKGAGGLGGMLPAMDQNAGKA